MITIIRTRLDSESHAFYTDQEYTREALQSLLTEAAKGYDGATNTQKMCDRISEYIPLKPASKTFIDDNVENGVLRYDFKVRPNMVSVIESIWGDRRDYANDPDRIRESFKTHGGEICRFYIGTIINRLDFSLAYGIITLEFRDKASGVKATYKYELEPQKGRRVFLADGTSRFVRESGAFKGGKLTEEAIHQIYDESVEHLRADHPDWVIPSIEHFNAVFHNEGLAGVDIE